MLSLGKLTGPPLLLRLLLVLVGLTTIESALQLKHVHTRYLPKSGGQTTAFEYDGDAVEKIKYHRIDRLLYARGDNGLHVLDMRNVSDLSIKYSIAPRMGYTFSDLDLCGDYIFVALKNEQNHTDGYLEIYRKYSASQNTMERVNNIQMNNNAKAMTVLPGCRSVLVAVGGKMYQESGRWVNPKGKVLLIELTRGVRDATHRVTTLDFSAYDSNIASYKSQGVRHIITQDSTTFSMDAEPTFITVDTARSKAYVVMQENNAIAEIDLRRKTITKLSGLGYKQWGYLDGSDEDAQIEISMWPIRSWYQPDAVKYVNYRGKRLLFTANEGSPRDVDSYFDEVWEGNDFPRSSLGSSIPEWVKDALGDENRLGELELSRYEGQVNNKYEALYTFGGRSWSIRDADSMELLYDSGSHIEESIALECPHLFNRDPTEDAIDGQSNEQGPGVEAITTAEIGGRLYVFVGSESPGIVHVYSIGTNVTSPRYESIFCDGFPESTKSPEQLYTERLLYAVDPEDMIFIPSYQSSVNYNILVVAGAVSGTVSVLQVKMGDGVDGAPGGQRVDSILLLVSILCAMMVSVRFKYQ